MKQLADLRRRTQACTEPGRFVDRRGLGVEGEAGTVAGAYDAEGVVGVSLGGEGGGAVRVTLGPELLRDRRVEEVRLHRQDGSTEAVTARRARGGTSAETRLARRESAVLEVRVGGRGAA